LNPVHIPDLTNTSPAAKVDGSHSYRLDGSVGPLSQ
jgi:hypothetical protein